MNWQPISEITDAIKAGGPLFCRMQFSDGYREYHVLKWDAANGNERYPWAYVYADASLDARASDSVVTHFCGFEEPGA